MPVKQAPKNTQTASANGRKHTLELAPVAVADWDIEVMAEGTSKDNAPWVRCKLTREGYQSYSFWAFGKLAGQILNGDPTALHLHVSNRLYNEEWTMQLVAEEA
ncbi:MAG: hypothetical protein ACYCSN_14625 [Acidobacteriaceae bacterium]